MIELTLKLTLLIHGPFNTKATRFGNYGVDAVLLRDHAGRPLLPGSQVRGCLRDALEEIESAVDDPSLASQIVEWFGPAVQRLDVEDESLVRPNSDMEGHRNHAWWFSDFVLENAATEQMSSRQNLTTRIAIDSNTGAVKPGAMLVTEIAGQAGSELPFAGAVTLSAANSRDLCVAIERFARGLCWVSGFGAYRTIGFGRAAGYRMQMVRMTCWTSAGKTSLAEVENVIRCVQEDGAQTRSPEFQFVDAGPLGLANSKAVTSDVLECRITVLDAFCIGKVQRSRNLVETEHYLPGSVFKGAVARQIQRILGLPHRTNLANHGDSLYSELCNHFSSIRFRAAFPADATQAAQKFVPRPIVAPLSLVKGAKDGKCRDVALVENPFLFNVPENHSMCAPTFQTDWKEPDTPGFESSWKSPDVELRIRTAIDPNFRRVRREYLFAQELVRPNGIVWIGRIDLTCVPANDRSTVSRQLQEVLQNAALQIGKTKARCMTSVVAGMLQPVGSVSQQWVVTLQSSAVMADPLAVRDATDLTVDPLRANYEMYWNEVSHGSLALIRFFADQELQGGFLTRRAQRNSCFPFFLTSAGSVFVLKATNNSAAVDAAKLLTEWNHQGLPLPKWATDRFGSDFQNNPFLPEDGFGEILINHSCHEELKPTHDETLDAI